MELTNELIVLRQWNPVIFARGEFSQSWPCSVAKTPITVDTGLAAKLLRALPSTSERNAYHYIIQRNIILEAAERQLMQTR